MILFITSLAFSQPLMTPLKEGEAAPFEGRLFNDEAVVSMLTMKDYVEEQCNIQSALDYSLELSQKQREIDFLKIEKETLETKHKLLMEIKEQELKTLRKHVDPRRALWAFLGGFIVGTGASLSTYYAVQQMTEVK
jgi:hypothetical protein